MKNMYEDALKNVEKARRELAEAVKSYDNSRHAIRTKMYTEKLAGAKYTDELIRSSTINSCMEQKNRYEDAQARFDIAKERLEFVKAICAANVLTNHNE